MSQNTSPAVMAQRVESADSLDDFPTQPWATRALVHHVLAPDIGPVDDLTCWEPACNRGHMSMPLAESFGWVWSTDIHDYGWAGQQGVVDFLSPDAGHGLDAAPSFVVTNPPFRLAEQFIQKALKVAAAGVAVIVRTAFLEGVGRHSRLFGRTPPSIIAQFTERVPMVKGRLTATGSTATAYCWLVWLHDAPGARFCWIPPCRKELERAGDYPSEAST